MPKFCPFAQGEDAACYGESCGCYIVVQKPNILRFLDRRLVDPEHFLEYKGCGLIQTIPWTLRPVVKQASKTEHERQAEEAYKKLEATR